jgi:hypothetical protein
MPREAGVFPPYHTFPDGHFEAGPVPPGQYRLVVMAKGLATFRSQWFTSVEGETADVGAVAMAPGSRITLRVEPDGAPVSATVFDALGQHVCDMQEGATGLRSAPLSTGRYEVRVASEGMASFVGEVLMDGGEDRELVVTRQRGYRCRVRLMVPLPGGAGDRLHCLVRRGGVLVARRAVVLGPAGEADFECWMLAEPHDLRFVGDRGLDLERHVIVKDVSAVQEFVLQLDK